MCANVYILGCCFLIIYDIRSDADGGMRRPGIMFGSVQ